MIYTLSWLPSITFLGVLLMFLIVTVFALAAVVLALVFALAILLALALAIARTAFLTLGAVRRQLPRFGRAGEPVLEAPALEPPALATAPRPAQLVRPRLHRVP